MDEDKKDGWLPESATFGKVVLATPITVDGKEVTIVDVRVPLAEDVVAAHRAAQGNDMQYSINLAAGVSSIGLNVAKVEAYDKCVFDEALAFFLMHPAERRELLPK